MSTFHVTTPTLCRLSSIAISKHLWKFTSLKDHLKCYIDAKRPRTCPYKSEESLQLAVDIVIKDLLLPEPAKEELKFVIGSMEKNIWSYVHDLGWMHEWFSAEGDLFATNASVCADFIHWTAYGDVDSPKTTRSLYYAGIFGENIVTWSVLTRNCLKDCLKDFRAKQSNIDARINQIVMPHLPYDPTDVLFHVYWMVITRGDEESVMLHLYRSLCPEFYDVTCSIIENMFMNAFSDETELSVKYFWGLMDDNQRMRVLSKCCQLLIPNDEFGPLVVYEGSLAIFTLSQLSHYGLEDMRIRMMGSADMLSALLQWPYDYLFINAIQESVNLHATIDYEPIMEEIIQRTCNYNRNRIIDYDAKYREFFFAIWKWNPWNLKSSIDLYLAQLWRSENIGLLSHIFRDPDLKHRRKDLLEKLIELSENKQIEVSSPFFDKFVAQILVPGEEWFVEEFSNV